MYISRSATTPGPVSGTRITEAYARLLTREAYFWAWPMANIYNKRLAFAKSPEPGLLGGVLPFPPVNRTALLTDYVDPAERANWLPTPRSGEFPLYVRAYWPKDSVTKGEWTPPGVVKVR